MGNKAGHPVIRNSSRYMLKISGYTSAQINPNQQHQFTVGDDNFQVVVTAFLQGRAVKGTALHSWKHYSWDVKDAFLQRHGHANMRNPQNEYKYWEWQNNYQTTEVLRPSSDKECVENICDRQSAEELVEKALPETPRAA